MAHVLNDGVIRGGGVVANAVDDLEVLLVLGVDAVVCSVVLVQEAVG